MTGSDRLLVFDLFSGTGSSTQAFADAGHTVISIELDPSFSATHTMSVLDVSALWLLEQYGRPDFIWASPPCTAFSVASIGHHWMKAEDGPQPRTEQARFNQGLVWHTRMLIEQTNPRFGYLIENPVGMLRKLPPVQGLPRQTISYCQYGDSRMKPTDLWGSVAGWEARPSCRRGDPCHEAAPRGSTGGTQGMKNAKEKSRIPYGLGLEIMQAIQRQPR